MLTANCWAIVGVHFPASCLLLTLRTLWLFPLGVEAPSVALPLSYFTASRISSLLHYIGVEPLVVATFVVALLGSYNFAESRRLCVKVFYITLGYISLVLGNFD
jgi:hypothetical protein